MRIDLVCFSARGQTLGNKLAGELAAQGDSAALSRCGAGLTTLGAWTAKAFAEADALLFIGSAGIAVRAIAPYLRSKTSDPAVVAVDETGRFAISLLSGHIGGANQLAKRIAALVNATPVVTTATDLNHVFAVDDWAARRGLTIANPEKIKTVSAALLSGKTAALASAFPLAGPLPNSVELDAGEPDIVIDISCRQAETALIIVPPALALGIGCRKGTETAAIDQAVKAWCAQEQFYFQAIAKICSIDLKKEENSLLEFCRCHGFPFETFPADCLAVQPGSFSRSEFVEKTTGVDNVCERAAVAGANGGRLLTGKSVINGITLAAAAMDYVIRFDQE